MNKLLSICIPTFNRASSLKVCLNTILSETADLSEKVEVIVSDNASTDDTANVIAALNKSGNFRYYRNETNLGSAKNFFKLVDEYAQGEFAWVLGDDDFIMPGSVHEVVSIIEDHPEIDYIFATEVFVDTNQVIKLAETNKNLNSKDFIHLTNRLNTNHESKLLERWELILDPDIRFDYLGFLPNSIFRTRCWKQVDKSSIELETFRDWKSTYPHLYIFGNSLFGKKAYYCGKSLIMCGEGIREWQGDNGFCSGYLPVIFLRYFDDILNFYNERGLKGSIYKKCRRAQAGNVGKVLPALFAYRYLHGNKILRSENIKLSRIIKYVTYSNFWRNFLSAGYKSFVHVASKTKKRISLRMRGLI